MAAAATVFGVLLAAMPKFLMTTHKEVVALKMSLLRPR